MKVLFLHLSDMNFDESKSYDVSMISKIVSSLRPSITGIEHCIIIVTGDLSFSGSSSQFYYVRKFFSELRKGILLNYRAIKEIVFLVVPGNHDVDLSSMEYRPSDYEEIEKTNDYESKIEKEMAKQKEFVRLSKMFGCFEEGRLVCKKLLEFNGSSLQINLINTACFSSRVQDQGFHYLSNADLEYLAEKNDNDFVITVMHHPVEWFTERMRKRLECILYTQSDLIFVGHEHYENSLLIENKNSKVNIIAGGRLSDRGDWSNSEIHISILDINTREFATKKYMLDENKIVYGEQDSSVIILKKNRLNVIGLKVNEGFLSSLSIDKYKISKCVDQYYVFPLLVEENIRDERRVPKEIDTLTSFLTYLAENKVVLISGKSGAGKTLFAYTVYKSLIEKGICIILNGRDIGRDIEKAITSAFEISYSQKSTDYQLFTQTPIDNLSIVIDDYDRIELRQLEKIEDYLSKHFKYIIKLVNDNIDVDINSRLRKQSISNSSSLLHLEPFYYDKRKCLITKIVNLVVDDPLQDKESIIDTLFDFLSKQRMAYNKNPDFIVQFSKHYCKNIGETINNNGNIFSIVFESNIVSLLSPNAKMYSVDKILLVLDKIAFGIFRTKEYPISIRMIESIIHQYNDEYDSNVGTFDFINLLIDSSIIKPFGPDLFIFTDRNYLSYFIAREIRRKCMEDNDYEDFVHVMDHSYISLYADVLLFITYIVDSSNFIKQIMDHAEKSVKEWKEFCLENNDISYLIGSFSEAIKPFEEGDREKEEERRKNQERQESKKTELINDSSIFELEKEELGFVQKVTRSISMMIILSRTLPSFEHIMKKQEKRKCVELIYSMPLYIFEAWAKTVDEISASLINEIKILYENEYRSEKQNWKPLSDDDALRQLRWDSTSLLLDLMNVAIGNSSRQNTWSYIDSFEYNNNTMYSIEHLMGIGRIDKVEPFIKESLRMVEDEKELIAKEMIRRVAKHYMVVSKKISRDEIQKMNDKLFNRQLNTAKITFEHNKNVARG